MGYRSEIAFCITVDGGEHKDGKWVYDTAKFKEMIGFFKLSKFYEIAISPDYNLVAGASAEGEGIGWKDGVLLFHAVGWKWYDGYPLVDSFYKMWDSMQDIEGISGFYLRSGEESGDVEELEFGSDPSNEYFHIYTGMSFDDDSILGEATTDEEETKKEDTATAQPDCSGANHATQA